MFSSHRDFACWKIGLEARLPRAGIPLNIKGETMPVGSSDEVTSIPVKGGIFLFGEVLVSYRKTK